MSKRRGPTPSVDRVPITFDDTEAESVSKDKRRRAASPAGRALDTATTAALAPAPGIPIPTRRSASSSAVPALIPAPEIQPAGVKPAVPSRIPKPGPKPSLPTGSLRAQRILRQSSPRPSAPPRQPRQPRGPSPGSRGPPKKKKGVYHKCPNPSCGATTHKRGFIKGDFTWKCDTCRTLFCGLCDKMLGQDVDAHYNWWYPAGCASLTMENWLYRILLLPFVIILGLPAATITLLSYAVYPVLFLLRDRISAYEWGEITFGITLHVAALPLLLCLGLICLPFLACLWALQYCGYCKPTPAPNTEDED